MTLVEVLAGLALLAALLMGVLAARSRAAVQWNRANERLRALGAADRLLAGWWAEPAALPRSGEGEVPFDRSLRWRTETVSNAGAGKLGAVVVRLRVGRDDGPGSDLSAATIEMALPAEAGPRP